MIIYSLVQMYHDAVYFQSLEGLAYAAHDSYNNHMYALKLRVCVADDNKLTESYITSLLDYNSIVTIQLDHGWFTVQEIVVND